MAREQPRRRSGASVQLKGGAGKRRGCFGPWGGRLGRWKRQVAIGLRDGRHGYRRRNYLGWTTVPRRGYGPSRNWSPRYRPIRAALLLWFSRVLGIAGDRSGHGCVVQEERTSRLRLSRRSQRKTNLPACATET